MHVLEGNADEIPQEYIMYKLAKEFGWTEKQIKESSYKFITSILRIMRIENDYIRWKNKTND